MPLEVHTLTGSAVQEALLKAQKDRTGPVLLDERTYLADEPIHLPHGAILRGTYPSVALNPIHGTRILATHDLEAILSTDTSAAREGFEVSGLLLDGGGKATAGLRLFGRKARISDIDIDNVQGIGLHLLPSSPQGGKCWVNWVTRVSITRSLQGLVCGASDSFIRDCWISGSDSTELAGGNVWSGCHFERSRVGLRLVAKGGHGTGSRIDSCYFDLCDIGLLVDAEDDLSWRWHATVTGNAFRANRTDIEVRGATGPMLLSNSHRLGGRSRSAYRFVGCTGMEVLGALIEPGYPIPLLRS